MNVTDDFLDLPIRRPRTVLALTLLVSAGLASGLPRLHVDTSIESMIVEGDALHRHFEAKKEVFGSDEVVAIAIPFGDALAAQALSVLARIAQRLEALPEVARVDSVVTSDDIFGRGDELVVEPLLQPGEDPTRLPAARLAEIRERALANPIWRGFLLSPDGRTAALQVNLEGATAVGADRGELLAAIEQAVESELGDAPYFLAGHPFMKTEIARTMSADLRMLLPASLAVMALLLGLSIGSGAASAVTFAGVLLSVSWMLGAMGWLGQPITAVSNTAPTILLALATACFMHLTARYQKEVPGGGRPAEIARRALHHVRRPTLVAGLTTAIGFGSLSLSRVPLIRGFGIYLAVGLIAVVLVGCTALPAALSLLRPRPGRGILAGGAGLARLLFGFARLVDARARWIVLGAPLLMLAALCVGSRIEVNSSGPNAFSAESRFRVSSDFYRAHLSGDVIENVYLSGPPEAFADPALLRQMLEFGAAAEALSEIDQSVSIASYVALMNRALYDNAPHAHRIPDSRDAVAQLLLLYSLSGDPGVLDDIVDREYGEARIVLKATVPSSRASSELRQRLLELAKMTFTDPAISISVVSTEVLLSRAARLLALEQVRSFAGALLLILLVVTLAFRSWRAGLLMILPNSLPIALNFAVMALAGIELSESTSVIAVISLGIAIDSSVHLLSSARAAEAAFGSRRAGVVDALLTTGRPVIVTSAIVIAGFAVLLLSDFRLITSLGGLTALTILYCLLADLVVLPAQLLYAEAASGESARSAATPALVTSANRAFGAILEHSPGPLSLRPLGDAGDWQKLPGAVVGIRALRAVRPLRARVRGVRAGTAAALEIEWVEPNGPRGEG